jgi:DNA-binding response OmpR family regulator
VEKILIVDDEIQMQKLISVCIQSNNFDIRAASSGKEAFSLIAKERFDLILLDIMMPEMSGLQLLKSLNQQNIVTPVIIISAIGETDHVVEGLNLGAYDYITKPFEPKELRARVQSVLRRTTQSKEEESSSRHGIVIKEDERLALYKNQIIPFTKKEYDIFTSLFLHPGRVYTRDQLLSLVWEHDDERLNRNVDVHIKNIREKLKLAGIEKNIVQTVWGVGYRIPHDEVKLKGENTDD